MAPDAVLGQSDNIRSSYSPVVGKDNSSSLCRIKLCRVYDSLRLDNGRPIHQHLQSMTPSSKTLPFHLQQSHIDFKGQLNIKTIFLAVFVAWERCRRANECERGKTHRRKHTHSCERGKTHRREQMHRKQHCIGGRTGERAAKERAAARRSFRYWGSQVCHTLFKHANGWGKSRGSAYENELGRNRNRCKQMRNAWEQEIKRK